MSTLATAAGAHSRARPGHLAWRGWTFAVAVYFLAVLHRSSLGVAGILAERRFGITPAQLAGFIFLQLGVYALMQVPTGVLVDRYGPRRMLLVATLVMGGAQLLFSVVASYPGALLARTMLGCGDALTFVSVLRYAAARFSARRYPLLVALTSMVGTAGNVIATLPLAFALETVGWVPSFAVAGTLSILAAVGVVAFVDGRDTPRRSVAVRAGVRAVGNRVRAAWALPGTRLGFWVHFSCMSAATSFGMLWGDEYLVRAAGFSTSTAGAVLMCGVIAAALASPAIGWLIGYRPAARVPLAMGVSVATATGWLVLVCALGDTPPRGYVWALFVVMALGAPASMVAFALARDYNAARTLGTASGVVNVGGFVATVTIALGIGWALDALGGTSPHTLRLAVLVAVAVQLAGTARVAVWLRRVRGHSLGRQQRGEAVPVLVRRRRWDLPDRPQAPERDATARGSGRMSG